MSLQEKQNYNSQWKASKHTAAARKDGYIIRAMRKARRREEGDGKEEAMTVARTDCSVATVATNLLLWGCDLRARMLLLMVECHNSVAIFNWSKRLATTKVELSQPGHGSKVNFQTSTFHLLNGPWPRMYVFWEGRSDVAVLAFEWHSISLYCGNIRILCVWTNQRALDQLEEL